MLGMVIADFFHYKNIPDRVVEYTWFKQLLKKAKYVGSTFKVLPRNKNDSKKIINISLWPVTYFWCVIMQKKLHCSDV